MEKSLIYLKDVSFQYEKDAPILKKVSFSAKAGESIGIVGANGVGKSTLMKLLVGLNTEYEGIVEISGIPVKKKTLAEVRKRVGYVFQDSDTQLFMSTAYEDIAFAPRNYGYSEKEVKERVERAMDMTGSTYLREKQIYKMSGGEKKLVSIATILAMEPEVMIMDEPSVALDPRNRKHLISLLNSFSCLKIITSHDLDMILDTCERTILLSEGEVVYDGPTPDIMKNKGLLEQHGLELPLRYGC